MPEAVWPLSVGDVDPRAVFDLLGPVVAAGGAVGFLVPPTRAESDGWLADVLAAVRAGDAGLVVLQEPEGRAVALGRWHRRSSPVFRTTADVRQVMVAPDRRGEGHGRTVAAAVVEHARAAGIESLCLGVRGNNHAASRLYESLGFVEVGVFSDIIAIGDERWDGVEYHLSLGVGPHVVRHGRRQEGAGAS